MTVAGITRHHPLQEKRFTVLENLNSIDWKNIRHSHGSAERFPEWIRALRSDDPETREKARHNLREYSLHQGTIYEVTRYLPPFLIELVAAPDTPDRHLLLDHLSAMAERSKAMFTAASGFKDMWKTNENVEAGMNVYLSLLDDPAPEVRAAAFGVICRFTLAIAQRRTPLIEAASHEKDPHVLSEMISRLQVAAASVWAYPWPLEEAQIVADFAASRLAPEFPGRVRLRAALAVLGLRGVPPAATQDSITEILRDALTHPEGYSMEMPLYNFAAWQLAEIGHMLDLVLHALDFLPRTVRFPILKDALVMARYAQDAHQIGRTLLDNIFWGSSWHSEPGKSTSVILPYPYRPETGICANDVVERLPNHEAPFRAHWLDSTIDETRTHGTYYLASPPPADLAALSAEERRLLRLVLDTDLVWMVHSNLLEAYGLPVHRDEARALLDEADAARPSH